MGEKGKRLGEELAKKIRDAIDNDGANIASSVNVGSKGQRTSVSSHQRIVQKDGVRTVTTERREERSADE
ncbi:MAG: hypothetical protein QOG16_605 [Actinomycetota bacterium]|jgi:hypothetical protein|nr:hypothetical protein [Actinomycetota bacterium]